MNIVQRARGLRKIIRQFVFRKPVQKFVTAGSRNCRGLMRQARARKQWGPDDSAILAWARFDLAREIISGFWEVRHA